MADTIQLDETFYIVAATDRTGGPPRVLKHGDTFAVFDQYGDIVAAEAGQQGLYYDGTRFLSRFELLLHGQRPLFLSSTVSDDNIVFTADLTNHDVLRQDTVVIPRGALHLARSRVLWHGTWVELIRVANYSLRTIEVPLTLRFDADFADIFEVRGTPRARRGERLADGVDAESVLRYRGLDRVERCTRVAWQPQPKNLEPGSATFIVSLPSHAAFDIELSVNCSVVPAPPATFSFEQAVTRARTTREEQGCRVTTSNESFNRWIRRSTADLEMMLTNTRHGLYPYAGIPWFSAPFGRDGIITALSLLWADPSVAKGVLQFLAATQALERDDENDAQPGKILHEMRGGEMAALREVPFGRYYGTVDATPLFVMLAAEYHERTADDALIERLWPHIVAALDWMRIHGDVDGDGFVEYARRSGTGLVQQGWKDSADSVFDADGTLAEPPIALCEVQGYVYAAWKGAARLARLRGNAAPADEWDAAAARLEANFDAAFWCDDLGTYALALDGHKRPCRVRTSNPGHCLYSGIVAPHRANAVAATLMSDAGFSGWGVRTLAAGEARYNPMSYHNGSIWPHDNAIAAAGLARYGLRSPARRIFDAMFDLSRAVDLHRLPELLCGFPRRGGEHPTLYPVACAPQAWAAAAIYLLMEAVLGLRINASARRVLFSRAALPEGVDWLRISNLRVGDGSVDMQLDRHPHDVGVTVRRRVGELEIAIIK